MRRPEGTRPARGRGRIGPLSEENAAPAALDPAGEFVALDFETANESSTSACSLGMVRVRNGEITARWSRLIRTPEERFQFSWLHGIRWDHVKDQPSFAELFSDMSSFWKGATYLVAHNAGFDRRVMESCLHHYGIEAELPPFVCTVQHARVAWPGQRASLDVVCSRLGIALDHHQALSDAEGCGRIMMHLLSLGVKPLPLGRMKKRPGTAARNRIRRR